MVFISINVENFKILAALTLIVVVFLLSYLHSQRGQNSFSFPLISSPTLGRTTFVQSHLLGGTFSI